VRLTFSRADIWDNNWGKSRPDTPLKALREVAGIGMNGVRQLFKATLILMRSRRAQRRAPAPAAAPSAVAAATVPVTDNTLEKQ
ncbi:hypothetical protein ABTA52_19290, partial [Acinetobacter baumannii]